MACQVTITQNFTVASLTGNVDHYFRLQEQYCYTRKVRLLVNCKECNKIESTRLKYFYEVTIDTLTYRIPEDYCVLYNQDIPDEYVDKISHEQTVRDTNDTDYPANGDYKGYITKQFGIKENVGVDCPDQEIIDELQKTTKKMRTSGENKTS